MRPALVAALAFACLLGWAMPSPAHAGAYLPRSGHVFAGLTGGTSLDPYERLAGKHPPVFEVFMTWNTPTRWLSHPDPDFRARLALHLSTSPGYGLPGVISPAAIAAGRSDAFLLHLGRDLAASRRIVYLRLMGEMDAYWNAYAAYSASGEPRGAQNSPEAFVQAWRRTVLILRGGRLSRLNARLRSLGLPLLRARLRAQRHAGRSRDPRLPSPRVAFLWVPQDAGSPQTAANSPPAFWPGSAYVDWVGTDFYGSYPNFALLDAFYADFPGKPFVLSEWALLGADDPGFVHDLFAWARAHPRVRMLNYYQGFTARGRTSLLRYPAARRALRAELSSRTFIAYPPEYAHPPRPLAHRRHPRDRKPPPERPPLPPQGGVPPGPPPSGPPPGLCVQLVALCLP